jgi:hypothetical protein
MTLRPALTLSVASIVAFSVTLSAAAESASSVSTSSASSSSSSAASAASSSSSVYSLVFPKLPGSCESNPDKDKCIPDALKNLERAKSDYVNMVARRRLQWITEHAYMGRTQEYLMMLQAFSTQLKEEGEVFMKKISEQTKIITAGRTNRRGRGASSSSSVSSVGAKTKIDQQVIDTCASVKDERKRRICIRVEANSAKLRPHLGKTYR